MSGLSASTNGRVSVADAGVRRPGKADVRHLIRAAWTCGNAVRTSSTVPSRESLSTTTMRKKAGRVRVERFEASTEQLAASIGDDDDVDARPAFHRCEFSRVPDPVVTVVVVTHRSADTIGRCLDAATRRWLEPWGPGELLVVLDAASAEVRAQVAASSARVLETPHNTGFAGGAAVGVEAARGEWVLLLNDDVFLEPEAVARMLQTGSSARGHRRRGATDPVRAVAEPDQLGRNRRR